MLQARNGPHELRVALGAMLLALNLAITGRLFFIEYLQSFGSIEPMFFAIARTIRERWPESGWWSLSNLGYPFAYAYQPLFHHLVAACASLTGWTEARSYHALTVVFYVLGPVSLYALMLRLTRLAWVSFGTALFYSLVSPAGILLRSEGAYAGTWQIVRLHGAVVNGDTPNMAGLTLVPLALLCFDRARERRTWGAWFLAVAALISIPLTNIPASLALGMALVAYCLACEWQEWPKVALETGAACVAGFLLFAPWLQPSGLMLDFRNTQVWMDPWGRFSIAKLPYYLGLAVFVAVLCALLQRCRASFATRFAVLFAGICVPIPLLDGWAGVSLLSESRRFHVAMEIPLSMMAALGVYAIARIKMEWTRVQRVLVASVVFLVTALFTVRAVHTAREWIREVSLENRPEATIASWMNQHAGTDRVYVTGSVSFWFNYLSRVPQVRGCCNQNLLVPVVPIVQYTLDVFVGEDLADTLSGWLQVLGVHYVAVSGPASLEAFRSVREKPVFEGVFPERWRSGDDVIYEVPLASASLAHAVRPEELIARVPINGIDMEPLAAYRAAVLDSSRPQAEFRFTSPADAVVEGSLARGFIYSVQMTYYQGWRASTALGESVSIGQDAIGFMTLTAPCDGPCEVRLHFDGGREVPILRALCTTAWLGAGLIFWRRRRIKSGIS